MASRKVDFALKMEDAATELADAIERVEMLRASYIQSGYNSGGSDPITDDDLIGHDVTATKLDAVSTLTANLTLFVDNGIPLQGDYRTTLGAVRKFS